ncbi:MAG: cytoplasmic protein [Planctomycetaceae bacterium]|jgi:hypothetical protein|nr:cytoplasmic protein [Planctomycetaceae bacterium]
MRLRDKNREMVNAHKYSINHKPEIVKDKVCGCFYCLKIYSPNEIDDWVDDKRGTALCPYCGIDSVIGESSGFPITIEFLKKMNKCWFDDSHYLNWLKSHEAKDSKHNITK